VKWSRNNEIVTNRITRHIQIEVRKINSHLIHIHKAHTSICFPSSGFNLLSYIKSCTLQFLFSILTLFTQRFPTHFSDFSVSQKPNQVSSQLKFFQRGNIVVGDAKKVYFMCILVPPIELSFSSLLKIWKAWRCLQRTLKSCYVCVSYLPKTHDHHQSSIINHQ
jgi:hypothetical protein